MLREQALQLLILLWSNPFRLPKTPRNLLTRTKDYLQTRHLRNIISWTKRANGAIEKQNFNEHTSSNHIRTWLYSGTITSNEAYGRLCTADDTWYDPHCYDSDDSEMTVNYCKKYPTEQDSSWIPQLMPSISVNIVPNKLIASK